MKIHAIRCKGLEASEFESKALSVATIPKLGAKIALLQHKKSGFEFMYQGREKRWRLTRWDAWYTDYDLCG